MASQAVRRTQAERTAETRARIMDAVVACIAEVGFGRTTAAEITRRAGVTWGAVQHHFGDKDGILRAVLEDSFARFRERVGELPGPDAPLDARVSAFVDGAWSHFGSTDYQSTFEILLQVERSREAEDLPNWQSGMTEAWTGIWNGVFADARLSPGRSLALQRYTISVLAGIAAIGMLGAPDRSGTAAQLDFLKDTLVRNLGGEA